MTDSIFDLKKSFIESQVRALSASSASSASSSAAGGLRPPRNWQDAAPATAEGDLPGKVVEQVLVKLNLTARKHNRLIYSAQAIRHVAEQIDALYREAAESAEEARRAGGGAGAGGEYDLLRRGVDLTDVEVVEALPEEYPATPGVDSVDDLERYQTLRARLLDINNSLKSQQQRHEYYTNLYSLLQPFQNPGKTVQPNLVTRGGPLDQEMEKMKTLALRLSVQIERAKELVRSEEEMGAVEGGGGEGVGGLEAGVGGVNVVEVLAGLERK
ncbi:kinetochore Sim4 complex subunit Fta4 [Peziza echinospora]|nr:kinetochore Sim4 complex subunit Fta4 [Peziza echinospora]